MAGQRAVGCHRDSPRPFRVSARGAGEQPASGDAFTPAAHTFLRAGMRSSPSLSRTVMLSSSIPIRRCAATDFDAHPFEPSLGVALQLLVERAEHGRRSFDEHDPGLTSVDLVIIPRHDTVSQLGNLADDFDAGPPRPDHDEGEILVALRGIRCQLSQFEGTQDVIAQVTCILERLHARRVGSPLVVAEVAMRRTGSGKNAVRKFHRRAVRSDDRNPAPGHVELPYLTEHHLRVRLIAHHPPQRRRNQTLRHDPRWPPGATAAGTGGRSGDRRS